MLDFNNLSIRRVIMHSIIAKDNNRDTASTEYELELFTVEPPVVETIKERLINAAGRDSKAFELDITETGNDSFYQLIDGLKELSDNDFISRSQEIAELLASKQKRTSIPGGYLIVIDALNPDTHLAMYIIIKAELHKALIFNKIDGQSQIELLDQIFLSPSQKLYKIGIVFEKNAESQDPHTKYGYFIFDDQFRTDGNPAEYFYKDFLGFTIGNNSKIQSKRFYDKTEAFIMSKITDIDLKQDLLSVLKSEFRVNTETLLTPSEFAHTYFSDQDILDEYNAEVVPELPSSFVKELVLIENKLSKKKVGFPDNIYISGPDANFDTHISFILTDEEFAELTPSSETYTIVKINGRPFSHE